MNAPIHIAIPTLQHEGWGLVVVCLVKCSCQRAQKPRFKPLLLPHPQQGESFRSSEVSTVGIILSLSPSYKQNKTKHSLGI